MIPVGVASLDPWKGILMIILITLLRLLVVALLTPSCRLRPGLFNQVHISSWGLITTESKLFSFNGCQIECSFLSRSTCGAQAKCVWGI